MKHFEPAAPVEGCSSKRVRCIHCSWTGAKNVSQQLHHLAVVCPTFPTIPEYQDEWRILVRNLPSSQLKTKKSKQAHALALQSCLPSSVLDGSLDSQEIRGDEPPGKRAKRGDSQSRAQNPNLSRALEHIMQVAAEAQDAQSSSPMLRQARVGRGRLSGINICMKAVRDEEVSHVLRQVLKEIKKFLETESPRRNLADVPQTKLKIQTETIQGTRPDPCGHMM
ncbi:hypothetical protein GUITHDRAFT_113821 [Guillardia theta CCMP2712]|uniref:Uncharacterized protein n=1 Tax=Guillardia theta (strain CCMP2712) TaxID=905079 RepID=L1IW12_GUITC|nr:hypothetical protein GUITHDRAFT_113821 [Guillardia theta CCMP2712]EKX40084.1 hypothetical protein GUITHDRAFT_113821 [Guillardia theta CCMP2712]|eukprot:XP_005827064.1 hypothetical protein GUITHDRAFT_113821 [Guillardia theta CCMP2712]